MVLSVSRRTDIPAYYSEWFFNRIKQGFVYSKNPLNPMQVSKIPITPEVVDCIVFWSKNPKPMLEKLSLINKYNYYFQFTLTPYDKGIEANLPPKNEILKTFVSFAETIGPERMVWRYDPVLLNDKYTVSYHLEAFNYMAEKLGAHCRRVTISFIDYYKKIDINLKKYNIKMPTKEEKYYIAKAFAQTAKKHKLKIYACAEDMDLLKLNILPAQCIDINLIKEIVKCPIKLDKDKNQREKCGCASSVDIGMYNSCPNGCVYCYANYSEKAVKENILRHNKNSPFLIGEAGNDIKISEKNFKSNKILQQNFFDML